VALLRNRAASSPSGAEAQLLEVRPVAKQDIAKQYRAASLDGRDRVLQLVDLRQSVSRRRRNVPGQQQ
jgi:hypothetical protein